MTDTCYCHLLVHILRISYSNNANRHLALVAVIIGLFSTLTEIVSLVDLQQGMTYAREHAGDAVTGLLLYVSERNNVPFTPGHTYDSITICTSVKCICLLFQYLALLWSVAHNRLCLLLLMWHFRELRWLCSWHHENVFLYLIMLQSHMQPTRACTWPPQAYLGAGPKHGLRPAPGKGNNHHIPQ